VVSEPVSSSCQRRYVEVSGVTLHAEISGADRPGRAIVLLHGFTGAAESMAGTAEKLAELGPTVCIDLVGHGRSDAPGQLDAYRMSSCVAQLVAVLDALELRCPHWLGYSMGGRATLCMCVSHPSRVASALLVGASAGIEDPDARGQRVRRDQALAARILDEGLEAFVDYWMALPMFASQKRLGEERLAAARRQRLAARPHGLAHSLRGMGAGAMPPLHRQLANLDLPVCLVAGDEDVKFTAIAADLARRIPGARAELIERAGHAAHLENPERLARVARRFFASVDACSR
jgi:2-succinyl-6-hydroxy-2,4-cyclohexadiene-1-carboxylate synthase